MGPEWHFIDVKVIQGGLLQVDFINMETKEGGRMFISPERFFEKLGRSMQYAHHKEIELRQQQEVSKDG